MERTTLTVFVLMILSVVTSQVIREHFYVDISQSWHGARSHCRNYYTDLSSLLTEDDLDRASDAARTTITALPRTWIGLSKSITGEWTWSSGGSSDFEKWHPEYPDSSALLKNCVYMYQGYWYNSYCITYYPFFCFKEYDRIMTLVQEKMTWEEALKYCRDKYTDLASLLSQNTAEQFVNNSTGAQTEFVWTGLRFLAGEWFWVNNDTLYHQGWSNAVSYQCPKLPFRCGALSMTDIVWEPRHCEEKLNFICYTELQNLP